MMPYYSREVSFDLDFSLKAPLRHKRGNTGSSHDLDAHYTTYYTPNVAIKTHKWLI